MKTLFALKFLCFVRQLRLVTLSALLCLFFSSPLAAAPLCLDSSKAVSYTVRQVVDGDTLRLQNGDLVRFIAINTPEIDHTGGRSEPLAKRARELLQEAIGRSKRIKLVPGREKHDRHHRMLAHVFNQHGENLQALLLSQGLAFAVAIPPNLQGMRCYQQLEQQARQRRLGIWALDYYHARSPDQVKTGFQRLKVTPTKLVRRGSWIFLEVNRGFNLRIRDSDLAFFPADLHTLLRPLVVRGWISDRKGHKSLWLRHPAAIESVTD